MLCALTGVLSLLVIVLPEAFSPVIAPFLVGSPEESIGFVFMGFAVRLSRLEQYRPVVRIVLWSARYSLLAAGVLGVQGIGLLGRNGPVGTSVQEPGLAVSICFILIGGALVASSGRVNWSKRVTVLLSLLGAMVASCWIFTLLAAAGLVPRLSVLEMPVLPLVLISLVTVCLALSSAAPRLLELLTTDTPAAEAARQTFPVAICLPVVLAILRHWAEIGGYVHPNVGLLAHVLVSVGAMAALVGWNIYRLGLGNRVRESIESAALELESHYRALMESIAEPVWIFDSKGTITFLNAPARPFTPGELADGNGVCMLDVLGKSQYQAIAGSAFFGRQLHEVTLYDMQKSAGQIRQISLVRVLPSRGVPAASFLLVLAPTGVADRQESAGLLSLENALKSELHVPDQPELGRLAHRPTVG